MKIRSLSTREQDLLKAKLGIVSLVCTWREGTRAIWTATLKNGDQKKVELHSASTETGALRELVKQIRPVML
jgi:hypothetical protein